MPFEFCICFSCSLNKDLTERNRKLEGEIMMIYICINASSDCMIFLWTQDEVSIFDCAYFFCVKYSHYMKNCKKKGGVQISFWRNWNLYMIPIHITTSVLSAVFCTSLHLLSIHVHVYMLCFYIFVMPSNMNLKERLLTLLIMIELLINSILWRIITLKL